MDIQIYNKGIWTELASSDDYNKRKKAFEIVQEMPDKFQEELMIWYCACPDSNDYIVLRMLLHDLLEQETKKQTPESDKGITSFGTLPGRYLPAYPLDDTTFQGWLASAKASSEEFRKQVFELYDNPALNKDTIHNWISLASSKDDTSRELAFELAMNMKEELVSLLLIWFKKTLYLGKQKQLYDLIKDSPKVRDFFGNPYNINIYPYPNSNSKILGFFYFVGDKDADLKTAILHNIGHNNIPILNLIIRYKDITSQSLKECNEYIRSMVNSYYTSLESA